MVKVKICGITNIEDALDAVKAGCDALGFAFFKKSPRFVTVEKVKEIVARLPKDVVKIGVFVNASEKAIKKIAKACKLDILQFHGEESPEFCKKFKKYKIIKAFRIKDNLDLKKILRYDTFAYLFDTYVPSAHGGTGRRFNWNLVTEHPHLKQTVFLSGGLTDKNVRKAINIVHPAWVDVCSSVELIPGKKDHRKVKKFIEAAKISKG